MNRTTIAAALVTSALVVPAALEADIQSDGPQMRPEQEVLELDDHTSVTLDLDRGVMPSGGKASVTLVATSETPHRVQVELSALQDMGYGGERVPNPPKQVDHRVVTLEAQPGGGPPLVQTFRLAKSEKALGRFEWFDIVATSALRTKSRDVTAARVGLATWNGNSFAMSIEPPVTLPAEGAFSIAVRVKNTTQKPMRVPEIRVGSHIKGVEGLESSLYIDSDDYQIEPADSPADADDDKMIAPGAESLAVYRVTPRFGVDHFTFVAHAEAYETGAALATVTVDRPGSDDAAPSAPVAAR